jgi:lysozyme family protein
MTKVLNAASGASAAFDLHFDRIIGHEGGYVNDPKDPGGETKWGISKRSYPDLNIAALNRSDAKIIWRRDFWDTINATKLPRSVVFQVFDFAGNSGIQTAIRHLQRAVDAADDGYWGPVSEAKASLTNEHDILMRLNAFRLIYMTNLSTWSTHSRGWTRRIAGNLLYAAEDSRAKPAK